MVPKVGVVRFGFLVGQILSIIGFASAEEFPILKTKTPQETYAKFDGLPVSQIEAARGLERAADAVRRRLELTEATLGSHHYLTKELKLLHSVYLSYLARPQRDQELAQNVFQAKLQDREDRVIAAREDETLEFSKQINKAMDENESYRLDSRLFDKNEFPTRLSQERQSRTVSLRDENVFSTRLLPYVQKVEEVYGKESYLYSEVQRHIAVELKRLARLGAARAFAKDHA